MTSPALPTDSRSRQMAAAALLLIALALVLAGTWYYQEETEEISRERYRFLAGIGDLKANQITQWRTERLAEAKRAGDDSLTVDAIKKFLSAPGDPALQSNLRERMKEEVTEHEYANTLLVDAAGNILFNEQNTHPLLPPTTQEAVRAALAGREAFLSDFFRSAKGTVHIDVAKAVRDREGRPLAVLVLRAHAVDHLFSLLKFWPTESPSTETVLVQREAGEVVLVNPLREDSPTASAEWRFPLLRTSLPSVQAALGKQGRFEGRSYLGVPVLADLLPIPGTSWFLISQMNRAEILEDARYRAGIFCLIVGLFLLLVLTIAALLYRRRQTAFLQDLIVAERKEEEGMRERVSELERFNQMTVGREVRMIELKQEINTLLNAAGQPEKYRVVAEKPAEGATGNIQS